MWCSSLFFVYPSGQPTLSWSVRISQYGLSRRYLKVVVDDRCSVGGQAFFNFCQQSGVSTIQPTWRVQGCVKLLDGL
jgi:hypothetical protein